jgi:TnpA family transposase
VFPSKQGELRQRYREGQEDQVGALGLVVNMIVLWNTLYINAARQMFSRERFSRKNVNQRGRQLGHSRVRF